MVRTEIITVGTELLQGKTLDTNARYLGESLSGMGMPAGFHISCRDDIKDIVSCLRLAFERAELIILTGGLGPTPDDITREALSRFLNSPLVFHKAQYQRACSWFKKMGRMPPRATRREAMFPSAGVPLLNQFGIALGFYVKMKGKLLVVLPGVPREMERLFETRVRRLIAQTFGRFAAAHELTVSLVGLDEGRMMERLGKRFFENLNAEFGSYPMDGRLVLRFKSDNARLLKGLRCRLIQKLGRWIYSFRDETLEETVGRHLCASRLTLALAESCTGGLLGKRLTDVPGSSRYFLGGIVSYANAIKSKLLAVPSRVLKKSGAVSRQTAARMALGVRLQLGADLGMSLTGIAGPEGGSRAKPVGLVWIGMADGENTVCRKFLLSGSRGRIRSRAVLHALEMLEHYLARRFRRRLR